MLSTHTLTERTFVLIAMLLFGVMTITAQERSGRLRGRITDEAGALIAGATVSVTDTDGKQTSAVANSAGEYVFQNLKPGKYSLIAAMTGFAAYENPDLIIVAGQSRTLDILLTIRLREQVTVQNERHRISTDPENSASQIVLSGSDLDMLSDDPDQLATDLQALVGPGDGPNISQLTVDGFSGGKLPSKASIREIRINANPLSAEQDFFGFGRIDIFTKPGSNKFVGQAFMTFNDESLNGRNPFAPNRASAQTRLYGSSFSGPLHAGKSSFFVDFDRREIAENAVVTATVLDSSFNPTPVNQVVVTPQQRTNFSTRVDFQLNPKHTVVARFNYIRANYKNLGVGGFSLPSRAYDQSGAAAILQLTETALLSKTVLNETRFQYVYDVTDKTGDNSIPTINVLEAFIDGGAQFGLSNEVSHLFELQNTTSWLKGQHALKGGARFRGFFLKDIAPTNFGGTFTFSSLAQYQQVVQGVPGARPAQFSIAGGNPEASARRFDLHLFFQDDWRVSSNFTLSFGLRAQAQTNVGDKINLGPRLSFAWAPGTANAKQPKTVIRGGAGIFYYSYAESLTLLTHRFNGIDQQQFIINNPNFFPVVPPTDLLVVGAVPQTIRRADAHLNQPYSIKAMLSVEQQLAKGATLSVTHIYERDVHLLRSRNVNAPLPGTFNPGMPGSGVRPFRDAGNIFSFETTSTNLDNTLFVNLNTQLLKKLSAFALIGLSKETNDGDGPMSFPMNSYDLRSDYGSDLNDIHAFSNIGMTYSGPWGLTFNSLIRLASANRFNITTGRDTNGDGVFTERPALAADLSKPGVVVTRFGAFDPNPESGQAIIPRNFGRGPTFFQVNLRAAKTFRFNLFAGSSDKAGKAAKPGPKRNALTVSVSGQNIFNKTNFGSFIGNINSPLFGLANATASTPRRLDLQVRFSF
ncbi:MAG TPA: carboxypeptidase-like regulatory domain-containing protein [Pyrinomonadaceae bacterium]|nr:carboxypeptidase-like regulatory domain-containing protein [Pyrinomonadaceae bacterium]